MERGERHFYTPSPARRSAGKEGEGRRGARERVAVGVARQELPRTNRGPSGERADEGREPPPRREQPTRRVGYPRALPHRIHVGAEPLMDETGQAVNRPTTTDFVLCRGKQRNICRQAVSGASPRLATEARMSYVQDDSADCEKFSGEAAEALPALPPRARAHHAAFVGPPCLTNIHSLLDWKNDWLRHRSSPCKRASEAPLPVTPERRSGCRMMSEREG